MNPSRDIRMKMARAIWSETGTDGSLYVNKDCIMEKNSPVAQD